MNFKPGHCVMALALASTGCTPGETEDAPVFTDLSFSTDTEVPTTALTFTDVTSFAGIDFKHENGARGQKWMPETVGAGGGFLDYDSDGWLDIFLVNSGLWPDDPDPTEFPSRLYRNLGNGHFEDVTVRAGLAVNIYGMGASFADFDGDGDTDIYVTGVGDNLLLRNDNSRFKDVTAQTGTSGNSSPLDSRTSWSTGSAWFDFNRDGWVDLFVCNYVRWSPETDLYTTMDGVHKSYATPDVYDGDSCVLYENHGGTRFENVTSRAGLFNPAGKSLGIAVTDINRDGWPDIAISNDTEANYLYLNRGDGTFDDIALAAGVGYDEFGRARAGMGIDIAHVGPAGDLTIAIGNFSREPLSMHTQTAPQLFSDRAARLGVATPTLMPLTFGLRFDDFDLDGNIDMLLANGHIDPDINTVQQNIHFAQRPQLLLGTEQGRFVEVSNNTGAPFTDSIVGRGVFTADYDRDGDLDAVITVNGGRPRLLRNDLPEEENNWVRFNILGAHPNTAALGAYVSLYVGENVRHSYIRTASSYLSQSYVNTLLFGIGDATSVDSISVKWPTTGFVSTLRGLEANSENVIREPENNRTDNSDD